MKNNVADDIFLHVSGCILCKCFALCIYLLEKLLGNCWVCAFMFLQFTLLTDSQDFLLFSQCSHSIIPLHSYLMTAFISPRYQEKNISMLSHLQNQTSHLSTPKYSPSLALGAVDGRVSWVLSSLAYLRLLTQSCPLS